ncbi:MAG: hypothetical protein WCT77_12660 [Bacteroidota bacterium]
MLQNRVKEIETIRRGISLPISEPEAKNLIFINGSAGVGKSALLDNFQFDIISKKFADAVISYDDIGQIYYLPDLMKVLTMNFKTAVFPSATMNWKESNDVRNSFVFSMEIIKENDFDLFQKISENSQLFSDAEFSLKNKSVAPADKNEIEKDLTGYIGQKGERRILLDTEKAVSESFIVDLMNKYFPFDTDTRQFRLPSTKEPVKIVLIFDNFERINYSLKKWITGSLFEYLTDKKFTDFVSYSISFPEKEIPVSYFFDFRFVIVTRENLLENKSRVEWESLSDKILSLELLPFSFDETEDYLDELNIESVETLQKAFDFSEGIPALLNYWVETFRNDSENINKSLLNQKAVEYYFNRRSSGEIEWLCCAAFLDYFDFNALRIFPEMNLTFREAYEHLKNSNDLVISSDRTNKFTIKPHIRNLIRESIKSTSEQLAKDYSDIADVYHKLSDISEKLDENEFNVARNLAYFKCFDKKFALENTFKSDEKLALNFIAKYPDWFIKNNYTMSMKPEIVAKFIPFNKLADDSRSEQKKELIRQAWCSYSEDLVKKVQELEKSVQSGSEKIEEIQFSVREKKKKYHSNQSGYFDIENELIALYNKIGECTKRKYLNKMLMSFFIAVVLGVLAYYFPDLFKDFYTRNADLLKQIQNGVYIASMAGGFVGLILAYFEIKYHTGKEEINRIKKQISSHEQEVRQLQDEMNQLQTECETCENDIDEMNYKLNLIKQELESRKDVLSECFL